MLEQRRDEADEFYDAITPPALDEDAAMVMRRALAGMLWTKQWYGFDVDTWLQRARRASAARARRARRATSSGSTCATPT